MSFRTILRCAAVVLFTMAGSLSAHAAGPADEEMKALTSRKKITSMFATVDHDISHGSDKKNKSHYRSKVILGSNNRTLFIQESLATDPGGSFVAVTAVNCMQPGQVFKWEKASGQDKPGGPMLAGGFGPPESYAGDRRNMLFIDPRKIGFYMMTVFGLSQVPLDGCVGSRKRNEPTVVVDAVDRGAKVRRVSFYVRPTCQITIDIDPARDHAVTRLALRDTQEETEASITNELIHLPVADTWFPSKCTFERKAKGQHRETEVATITVHAANQPIDEAEFHMKNWPVPVGTPITGVPGQPGVIHIWDGDNLTPAAKTAQTVKIRGMERATNYWYYAGAAGLSAIAAMIAWRLLRRPSVA